jgi:hypothetical protein
MYGAAFHISPMRVSIALITVLLAAAPARAQDAQPNQPPAWVLDIGASFLSEAWNYNESREVLAGGSLTFRRRPGRSWTIGGEWLSLAVKQRGDDAWVNGGGVCVRWTAPLPSLLTVFGELGVGISYATRRVPVRGTQMNYMIHPSVGVARPFTQRTTGALSLTVLHLSNAGREGRGRNPDIEAVGVTIAVSRSF